MKQNDLKAAGTIFKGYSILDNYYYLKCYNFCFILTKVANLHFLEKMNIFKYLYKDEKLYL